VVLASTGRKQVGEVGPVAEERDFDERLAAIARELVNEPDTQHTLQRIVELAAANLDGEVYASVSLVRQRRQVQTPASSDERAARADQLQYEANQGPCLDAIWEQDTFQIDDMTTEQRYPDWARRVAEQTGIRSSLSLQLFTNADSLGALNLYSPQLRSFDAETRGEGLAFAAQAAVALRSAQNEQHLRTAIASHNLIGQAQGILMERFKMTAERAFAVLARASQDTNVKLRDVAQRLIDTRETPGR
jgi:transcriptional regulator with GAF, ATPase, and Fis domain